MTAEAFSPRLAASGWARESHGGPTLLVGLAVLAVGFGDGVGRAFVDLTGAPSPWLLLMPVLGAALALHLVREGDAPRRPYLGHAYVWSLLMLGWLTLEIFAHPSVHLSGYLQLTAFGVAMIVVQGVFAEAPEWLVRAFARSLVGCHYGLCAYVAVAFVSWHALGFDPSLVRLVSPAGPVAYTFRDFRPLGFSVEPELGALSIAASYLGLFHFAPGHRLPALAALVLTSVMLQAGTLVVFAAIFAVACLASERDYRRQMTLGLVVLALGSVEVLAAGGRIETVIAGDDPSFLQRSTSVDVARDVIEESFPVGVGYGNFRSRAVYGAEWSSYLDLSDADFYKSDLLVLNLLAEMGVAGLVVLGWMLVLLARARRALPVVFYFVVLLLSGTLLIPALLVVAATTGLILRTKAGPA